MAKDIIKITLETIDGFCKRKGLTKRDFGAQHMNDPYFVYRLEKRSTDPRVSTIQKAWDAVTK
jgi:predicted transcriptional regulator